MVRAGESLLKLTSDLKQYLILNDFPRNICCPHCFPWPSYLYLCPCHFGTDPNMDPDPRIRPSDQWIYKFFCLLLLEGTFI
jgi:hypothetical protein